MRINALALKNLNSLRGEFRIDFEAEPLASAGIFAITGPTGAGKTTLLDAICVALYGQTPRLAAGNSAELLTRNTGECYAEVEFTVEQGRFRSHWSRRRARGKADGNLQPTVMELVAVGEDGVERIIEDQVRLVVERVEALTGLDFARFTRSVMLAQGSFASFLKAKDNERAELLERMTGTRLYSYISIQAFNRARDERQRLDELIAVNAHLALLPPDEMAAVQSRKSVLAEEIAGAEQGLALLRGQEACAVRYRELVAAIAEAESSLAQVAQEQIEAAPSLARLAEAEAALPLAPELRALDDLAGNLERLGAEAGALAAQADAVRQEEDEARRARQALDLETNSFVQAATLREEAIRAAEALDQQIAVHRLSLSAREKARTDCDADLAAIQAEVLARRQAQSDGIARQQELDAFLAGNAADAGLAHDIGMIAGLLQQLATGRQQFAVNRREQERVEGERDRLANEAVRLGEQRVKAGEQSVLARKALGECEGRLAEVLLGRTFEHVEAAIAEARRLVERIDRVLALEAEARRLATDRGGKEELAAAITRKLDADNRERDRIEADKVQAEQTLALLEENQRLAALVAKYEADRARLVEGEACPLCGSPAHPWRTGAPVTDADADAAGVERQRLAVKALLTALAELDGRMRERRGAAATLAREVADLATAEEAVRTALVQARSEAGLAESDSPAEARAAAGAAVAAELERLAAGRRLQEEREALLRVLFDHDKNESALVATMEKSEALIREQAATLTRLQGEADELLRQGTAVNNELEAKLAGYGLSVPPPGREQALAEQIRQRWRQFDQVRQDRVALEGQLQEIRRALDVLTTREVEIRARREREETAAKQCADTIATLAAERMARLGSEPVESARQRLGEERVAVEARVRKSDTTLVDLATRAAAVSGALSANAEQGARLEAESRQLAQAFAGRLAAAGFADVSALRQALLPEDQLQALRTRRDELAGRRSRLEERLAASRSQRQSLGQEAASLDVESLRSGLARAGDALAAKQQELGAVGEAIRRQEELVNQHRRQTEQIEAQRRELRHWQGLSDLIGSADGKKFRRFAQGLTLDHLIRLANRQLVRLTDRYLLRRHQEEELGLEIIDTYQADAVRPTATLSGGEEFLVSLALALGLANLGGQARIDSLFLDEGFGTLDTDTLETALAALAALHETGKTIGVISHVDALKERIPVQIRLRRVAGGCSDLVVVAG